MDDEVRKRIEEAAETNALLNAVKHDSEAQVGAIMGPLMGENPEFREYGDEIPGVIAPVVERVNDMSSSRRRERIAELAPERLAEIESEDEGDDHPLPDLPNAEDSELGERLWADYQEFAGRDLGEYKIAYLFVDGIAERIRPGQAMRPPAPASAS
jgi:hypothetical protein